MLKYLLLASFIPALLAFGPCTSGGGNLPDSVVSSICAPDGTGCTITVGQNIDIVAVFTASVSTDVVHPKVTAFVLGAPISIPTPTINESCGNHLTPDCPIVEGETYTYSVEVAADVPALLVGSDIEVELALVDGNDAAFACLRFPARVSA